MSWSSLYHFRGSYPTAAMVSSSGHQVACVAAQPGRGSGVGSSFSATRSGKWNRTKRACCFIKSSLGVGMPDGNDFRYIDGSVDDNELNS